MTSMYEANEDRPMNGEIAERTIAQAHDAGCASYDDIMDFATYRNVECAAIELFGVGRLAPSALTNVRAYMVRALHPRCAKAVA